MALTLAWSKSFSAFLMICLALEAVKVVLRSNALLELTLYVGIEG